MKGALSEPTFKVDKLKVKINASKLNSYFSKDNLLQHCFFAHYSWKALRLSRTNMPDWTVASNPQYQMFVYHVS